MKLTRNEESRLLTQGITAVVVCFVLAAGLFYGTRSQAIKMISEAKGTMVANESILDTNRKEAKEIRFLRDNSKAIETMWSTLKGWGDGVKLANVAALTESGLDGNMPIAPTKIPGNPTEYAGMRLSGDKTEFQRMMAGLAKVEANQGLLQVRSATLSLPQGVEPNAKRPTFLNIQLEIVAPSSK